MKEKTTMMMMSSRWCRALTLLTRSLFFLSVFSQLENIFGLSFTTRTKYFTCLLRHVLYPIETTRITPVETRTCEQTTSRPRGWIGTKKDAASHARCIVCMTVIYIATIYIHMVQLLALVHCRSFLSFSHQRMATSNNPMRMRMRSDPKIQGPMMMMMIMMTMVPS